MIIRPRYFFTCLFGLGLVLATDALANTPAGWQALFHGPGLDARVSASTWFRGELIVAGNFNTAGDREVRQIARWDGERWQPLTGTRGIGAEGAAEALAVFEDRLYVGGGFTAMAGIDLPLEQRGLLRWDGADWEVPGAGVPGNVRALAVHDGALFIGGSFTRAGGVNAFRMARWNGESYSGLVNQGGGNGVNGEVFALASHGSELIAGGSFLTAGGQAAIRIAGWDGLNWSALEPNGLSNIPFTLKTFGADLIVGGLFDQAGGQTVNRIARWDGSQWHAMPGPDGEAIGIGGNPSGSVFALEVFGDALIVAGGMSSAGGVAVSNMARWHPQSGWSALPGADDVNGPNRPVSTVVADAEGLYIGGQFISNGNELFNHLARWQGGQWSAVAPATAPETGLFASNFGATSITSMVEFQEQLIVAGSFTHAGKTSASNIATWDGERWQALGSGITGTINAMLVHDNTLIVGGSFTAAGGIPATNLARWDGGQWSALSADADTGFDNVVVALASYGGDLVAGGNFRNVGGIAANRIARWDGQAWHALGSGASSSVRALAVQGNDLIVGGSFSQAGGITVNSLARWDGNGWASFSGGAGASNFSSVFALLVDGETVYAGGSFTSMDGVPAERVASWDGQTWSALTGSQGNGVSGFDVNALTLVNSNLYVGGRFFSAGGIPAKSIARWEGSEWAALGGADGEGVSANYTFGSGAGVSALLPFQGLVYVGGDFTAAGGVASWRIGAWRPANIPPPDTLFSDRFEASDQP
ncbi:MAG: hypothetical protein V2J42_03115 [Wenzhouxiangella sp.]|nr:hypothetical protein [Wenzhouxiangella sp.]